MTDHSDRQYEHIDDYLLGRLSGDGLDAFENRMNEDDKFRQEVELHKKVMIGIIEHEEDKIRDLMLKADRELDDPVNRKIPVYKYFRLAAVVLLLISVGVFLIFYNTSTNEKLFSRYFDPYENDLVMSSRSDQMPDVLADLKPEQVEKIITGMKNYDRGKFEKASQYLDQDFIKEKDEIRFYLALSQLADGQDTQAINNLERLVKIPQFRYNKEVSWYLALALLKTEKEDESRTLLVQISKSNSPFSRKAKALLDEII